MLWYVDGHRRPRDHSSTQLRLILPDQNGCIGIGLYDNNDKLNKSLNKYFEFYGGLN